MALFLKVPFSLLILVLVITSLMMFPSSLAQDSAQDFVDAHNAARAEVGVGPIQWDENVANYARQYAGQRANDCAMMHSGGPYGENLAGSTAGLSGIDAVRLWVSEKQSYDYASNSCVGGECRHYTQVVWKNSARVGCAKVSCSSGGTFITCNYDPPGNYVDQRPY